MEEGGVGKETQPDTLIGGRPRHPQWIGFSKAHIRKVRI